jgi:hypothetical protein
MLSPFQFQNVAGAKGAVVLFLFEAIRLAPITL